MAVSRNRVADTPKTGRRPKPVRAAAWVALTLVHLSCGGFDNASVLGTTEQDIENTTCDEQITVVIDSVIAPQASRQDPWVGWLHGHAIDADGNPVDSLWTVQGLPADLALTRSGRDAMMSGIPRNTGTYTVTATLQASTCASAQASETFELIVDPPCDDCAVDCTVPTQEVMTLWVEVVSDNGERRIIGPGETLGHDGVTVTDYELLGPDADTTHQIVLDVAQSKDAVVIHYTLPGGIRMPLGDAPLDLRYIHGDDGDRYLFLSVGDVTLFALYDGFMTPAELAYRCPTPKKDPNRDDCRLPDFRPVVTSCERDDGRATIGMSVPTGMGADLERRVMIPGQSEPINGPMLRMLDSWACGESSWCDDEGYLPPHHLSFFQMPTSPMVCGITHVGDPPRLAPFETTFSATVLHATSPDDVQFDWPVENPIPDIQIPLTRGGPGDSSLSFTMPAVGVYTIRVKCGIEGQPGFGTAEERIQVRQRSDYRLELWWRVVGSGSVDTPPSLAVGSDTAIKQGPNFQGIDVPAGLPTRDVTVRYEPEAAEAPSITAHVRLLQNDAVVHQWALELAPTDAPVTLATINTDGSVDDKGPNPL